MQAKTLILALMVAATSAFGQQEQQTLFKKERIRGGFGGPIFSWSNANGHTGYGAGGGGGIVLDRFFVGAFGMGETFEAPRVGETNLALGYGGLWVGFVVPSPKILHLYTSLKLGLGDVGTTDFDDEWEFYQHWNDFAFVAVPEAGIELNVTRWMRVSGSVGYRFVNGFDGWDTYGKRDLNAPQYNLTFRFGKFGK